MKMDTITLNPTTSNPSLLGATLKNVPPVPNNETTNAIVIEAATLDDGVCLDVVRSRNAGYHLASVRYEKTIPADKTRESIPNVCFQKMRWCSIRCAKSWITCSCWCVSSSVVGTVAAAGAAAAVFLLDIAWRTELRLFTLRDMYLFRVVVLSAVR